jgi:hypothetical protein
MLFHRCVLSIWGRFGRPSKKESDMKTEFVELEGKRLLGLVCVALLVVPLGSLLMAQPPAQPAPPPPTAQLLSPPQLENLVAPIALYPDPLLGQVLAASTYPLEVVQAQQWLQQNSNLHGDQLMSAARQQNWDPSVQALVAFPDILSTLTRDVQWTTDLGNAFLAQQNDVMAAVQRMRVRAQRNGKLRSTPQQNVTTQNQDGQSAVVIEPADPQVIYVPSYNPAYVWGPPAYGYYPPLFYPGIGFGFGFGPGIYLGGFFPGWGFGWGGWGLGWGWGCGWFGGGLFVNAGFFNHYGFGGGLYGGRFAGGRAAWAHDPMHRAGVGYANRNVAARYNNSRFAAGRSTSGAAGRSFNNAGSAARGSSFAGRSGAANASRGSYGASRGSSSYGRSYSNSGSGRGYSAPNSGRSFSSSGQGSRAASSSPRSSGFSSGSRPSGGSSGARSFGGGGSRSAGGGSRGGRR